MTVAILATVAVALSPPVAAADASRLHLFARRVGLILTDGGRYVVFGRYGATELSVFDTVTQKRWTVAKDPRCDPEGGTDQVAYGGHLLLRCSDSNAPDKSEILNLRTGAATDLGTVYSAIGAVWLDRNSTGWYLNRRTGAMRYLAREKLADLNDSQLHPVCGHPERHGLGDDGNIVRFYGPGFSVRTNKDYIDPMLYVPCNRRGRPRRIGPPGDQQFVSGHWVTWRYGDEDTSHSPVYAYNLRTRRLYRWHVYVPDPGVDTPVWVGHTRNEMFVALAVGFQGSFGDLLPTTAFRVYSTALPGEPRCERSNRRQVRSTALRTPASRSGRLGSSSTRRPCRSWASGTRRR